MREFNAILEVKRGATGAAESAVVMGILPETGNRTLMVRPFDDLLARRASEGFQNDRQSTQIEPTFREPSLARRANKTVHYFTNKAPYCSSAATANAFIAGVSASGSPSVTGIEATM